MKQFVMIAIALACCVGLAMISWWMLWGVLAGTLFAVGAEMLLESEKND